MTWCQRRLKTDPGAWTRGGQNLVVENRPVLLRHRHHSRFRSTDVSRAAELSPTAGALRSSTRASSRGRSRAHARWPPSLAVTWRWGCRMSRQVWRQRGICWPAGIAGSAMSVMAALPMCAHGCGTTGSAQCWRRLGFHWKAKRCRMTSRSHGYSFFCFTRTCSRTPTLPKSCRRPA